MTQVFFCSDLHVGHTNILKFSPDTRDFPDIEAHDAHIKKEWSEKVTKRDTVYVCGDLGWGNGVLEFYSELPGRKILIRGNHDGLPSSDYLSVFDEMYGMIKYKGYWVTHCPMHEQELWGCANIHGHVHSNTIMRAGGSQLDTRYINLCPENRKHLDDHWIIPFNVIKDKYPPKLKGRT